LIRNPWFGLLADNIRNAGRAVERHRVGVERVSQELRARTPPDGADAATGGTEAKVDLLAKPLIYRDHKATFSLDFRAAHS
jgi:hypothetical protein